jgi:hypothetical protein
MHCDPTNARELLEIITQELQDVGAERSLAVAGARVIVSRLFGFPDGDRQEERNRHGLPSHLFHLCAQTFRDRESAIAASPWRRDERISYTVERYAPLVLSQSEPPTFDDLDEVRRIWLRGNRENGTEIWRWIPDHEGDRRVVDEVILQKARRMRRDRAQSPELRGDGSGQTLPLMGSYTIRSGVVRAAGGGSDFYIQHLHGSIAPPAKQKQQSDGDFLRRSPAHRMAHQQRLHRPVSERG